ncbi:MAG: DUF3276 family protein, partial [Bacteroidota bacterium]
RRFESVYSKKVRAGRRRTYFFDVRKTKGEDYYLTLTESTKRFNGDGYERHKIFLYKEDIKRFQATLDDVCNHIMTVLMPDYDYDEYTRRHEEWEKERAALGETNTNEEKQPAQKMEVEVEEEVEEIEETEINSEDDMSW